MTESMKGYVRPLVALAGAVTLTCAGVVAVAGQAVAAPPSGDVLFVSARHGADSATCGAPSDACATIGQAITNAAPGATVRVLPGTYHEQVVVPFPLTLDGHGATVDATRLTFESDIGMDAAAITVLADHSTVEGFGVTGAYGEGILVLHASYVTVAGNHVWGNDLGTPGDPGYMECEYLPESEIPGDCGEAIHLMSATDSTVAGNRVTHNAGGVLVTDELGPAARNRIIGNLIADNPFDCGITLPSHSDKAVDTDGNPQPSQGGVYDNLVANNRIFDNGLLGEGAGVLIAGALPGSASYDNTVTHNVISGNDLAGVTIHSHFPQQDLSGNVITDNTIGTNNVGGDTDASVTTTTGVLVFSAVVDVDVTISHNHIHGDATPIWTTTGKVNVQS